MNEKNNLSSKNYSENVAEKSAVANKLLEDVNQKIKDIFTPEKYVLYLDVTERFHWYSYINNFLILSQFPHAVYLAGYTVWEQISLTTYNDPNRRILRST